MKKLALSFLVVHGIFWGFALFGYLFFSFVEWRFLPLMNGKEFRVYEALTLIGSLIAYFGFKE